MYYAFFNIRIYIYCIQKNTSGLQHCLGWMMSREDFQANPNGFKTVLSPQTVFYTLMFIRYLYSNVLYMHVCFSYFIMFSTSQCSRLRTFIIYSICSLSMLYTHSSHFPPFKLRCCQCYYRILLLRTVVELLVFFSVVGGFFLVYPLDRFYKLP